jgi:hypothetical protein
LKLFTGNAVRLKSGLFKKINLPVYYHCPPSGDGG